jgi:hypothetical protein
MMKMKQGEAKSHALRAQQRLDALMAQHLGLEVDPVSGGNVSSARLNLLGSAHEVEDWRDDEEEEENVQMGTMEEAPATTSTTTSPSTTTGLSAKKRKQKERKQAMKRSKSMVEGAPAPAQPTEANEVLVMDASGAGTVTPTSTLGSHPSRYKEFMSAKISKVTDVPTAAQNRPAITGKEAEKEEEMKRMDTELAQLLRGAEMMEALQAGELQGVDRRRYREQRLVELGAKVRLLHCNLIVLPSIHRK